MLRQVASEAMQYPPPRDMVVLRASASKYLLTSLEPALALGEEIRRELSESQAAQADAAVAPDDRGRAADLLDTTLPPHR